MTVKQLLSVIIVALLLVPLTVDAKTQREWLTGMHDVPTHEGIHRSLPGEAIQYEINSDRSNFCVRCTGNNGTCYALGYDSDKGWYVDFNCKTNAIIPPYDENEVIHLVRVPQKEGEEVQVEVLYDGSNLMR